MSRAGPEPPRALPVGLQEAQGGRTPGGGVRLETRNLPAVFPWNRRQEPNSDTVFFFLRPNNGQSASVTLTP